MQLACSSRRAFTARSPSSGVAAPGATRYHCRALERVCAARQARQSSSGLETDLLGDDVSQRYRALYLEVVSSTTEQLRIAALGRAELLSLSFLQWLATREAEAVAAERAQLSDLCGRLVAIREGIDAQGLDTTTAGTAAALNLARQLAEAPAQDELSIMAEVDARKGALAQRQAALALSPEQAALMARQVAILSAGIQEQKQRSALQLMSRKQLSPADLAQGFGEADAADRILQVLLELPGDDERQQMLPEAFMQAPAGSPEDPDADVDLLSTSPLRLLQAIDFRLEQWNGTGAAATLSLPAGRKDGQTDDLAIMSRLRTQVLSFLE